MKLSNQYIILKIAASDDHLNLDDADDYDENEPHDQELEDVNNMVRNVGSIASNSYRRTRTSREFPIDIMMKALKYANGYRDWVKRKKFPVSLDNADAAISALTDAILDWRRTGGVFETAHYHKGADPASAENIEQFALFFHKRIHQPLVYGKQWGEFPHYWDLFIRELYQAFEVWKQQRAEQKTWGRTRRVFMKLSNQYRVVRVATHSGDIPPEPGTTPISPDHVRLYHYTGSRDRDATAEQLEENLRQRGIDIGQAKGSTYGEPNVVWASTKAPGKHKVFAEFDIHKDDPRWDINRPRTPQDVEWMNKGNVDVTFKGSIKPEEILAIHMPWHYPYRYLMESDMVPDVLSGKFDYLLKDDRHPAEAKAVEYIKSHHSKDQ